MHFIYSKWIILSIHLNKVAKYLSPLLVDSEKYCHVTPITHWRTQFLYSIGRNMITPLAYSFKRAYAHEKLCQRCQLLNISRLACNPLPAILRSFFPASLSWANQFTLRIPFLSRFHLFINDPALHPAFYEVWNIIISNWNGYK